MIRNPFTPTFGASPLVVGDRDRLVAQIEAALQAGPRHPAYTTLATGERGMGKTVLLNEIEDMAHRQGWRVMDATASDGLFIDEIVEGALALLEELRPDSDRITRARVQLLGSGGGLETAVAGRRDVSVRNTAFRVILGELADHFAHAGSGLLITVDEMHTADIAETRRFGTVMQKITRREQKPVAFVGAGLPRLLTDLMSGDAATFLQRCYRMEVGPLDITATKQVLSDTFRLGESHIAGDSLHEAAIASRGHPYMTQLIGYEIWNAAPDPAQGITTAVAATGIATARRVSADIFVVPGWDTLSEQDRRFLEALAQDDSDTAVSDVAERTGMSPKQVSAYRDRLIRKRAIVATRYGYVTFADPATREWLQARSAAEVHRTRQSR